MGTTLGETAGNRRWGPQERSCEEEGWGVEAVRSRDSPDFPTGTGLSVIHETDINVLIFKGGNWSPERLISCPSSQTTRAFHRVTHCPPQINCPPAGRIANNFYYLLFENGINRRSAFSKGEPEPRCSTRSYQGENSVAVKEKDSQEYTQCPWYAPGNVGSKPLEW